jgi:Predicted membrane protein
VKNNIQVKRLVQVAVLIAVEVVLSRFLSISTPIVKIGFAFLPIALVAMLYGPLWAGATGALGDFIGAILFPIGAYFPGFTLTAFLSGFVFGVVLHHNEKKISRICAGVAVSQLLLHLGLNTVWLWMITGRGYLAILPTRVAQCALMIPIQILSIYVVGSKLYLIKPFLSPASLGTDTGR